MGEHGHGVQTQVRAIQRAIQEVSSSFKASCCILAENAGNFMTDMQQARQNRGHPFAAVNLPFARSADSEGGGTKRKKKRIPRPGERLEEQEATEDAEATKKAESKPNMKKQQKESKAKAPPKVAIKDDDDQDTPELVRRLNRVEEPPPADDAEAVARELYALRASLTEDQKAELDKEIWDKLGRKIKVDVDGETMSLRRLAKEAEKEHAVKKVGADEPAIRHKLREEVQASIPGWAIRQDAPKMQLKPDEHEALELDRFGEGHLFSPRRVVGIPYGVLHDFAWGMFGRIDKTRRALENRWSGRDPDEVLARQEFYEDILDNADKVELTLMMTAERPIPLKKLRESFLERQCLILTTLPAAAENLDDAKLESSHQLILARIKREATVNALARSGLIDKAGNIVPDTKLIVAVGPQWQLTAEAITAGRLRDQRTVFLGRWQDKEFARGVMSNFLGLPAVDPIGKTNVGNGVLYVTNGFNFQNPEDSGNPNQFYNQDSVSELKPWSSVAFEGLTKSCDMWVADQPTPQLVSGISRLKRA